MQYQRRAEDRFRQDQQAGSRNQQSTPRHLHPISPFPPHHHEQPPSRTVQRHPTMPSSNRQQPVYQSHSVSTRPIYRNQHFPTAPLPPRQLVQPPRPQYAIEKNFRSPASRIHARQDQQNDFAPISQRPRIVDPPLRPTPIEYRRPEHDAAEILQRMGGGGWVGCESRETEVRRGSEDSGFGESRSVATHGNGVVGVGWTDGIRKAVWGDDEQSRGLARGSTMLNQNQAAEAIWTRVVAATSAISTSVGALAKSNDDDDTSLDADGNTKLTRVIKQYHISTAQSSADLPQWLFSPSDLGYRSNPPPNLPPPISQRPINRSYSDAGHRQQIRVPLNPPTERMPQRPPPEFNTQPNRPIDISPAQSTLPRREDGWGWDESMEMAGVSRENERGSKTTNRLRKMKQEKVVRAATYSGSAKERR